MFGTNGGVRVQRRLSGLIQASEMEIVHGTPLYEVETKSKGNF